MPICRAGVCRGVLAHSFGLELVVPERAASSGKQNKQVQSRRNRHSFLEHLDFVQGEEIKLRL